MTQFIIDSHAMPAPPLQAGLHVVSTPIGNLGDVTLRALATLAAADTIACEDTRVTAKLLARYGIRAPLLAYHEHNAAKAGVRLLEKLAAGASVALVSDAGTPLVSDPGARLVAAARLAGHDVYAVPGPSAPLAALAASGLPARTFLFDGFLPARTAARRKRLQELGGIVATLLLFESPNRLAASLADIASVLGGDRTVCVCRELTKLHEEVRCGPAANQAQAWRDAHVRGEIVLVIAPPAAAQTHADPTPRLRELLADRSVSRAAALLAAETGLPRRELYRLALTLSAQGKGGDAD
jgi:16S rRNA (cytidine1402-2'-O)-methyltransferase